MRFSGGWWGLLLASMAAAFIAPAVWPLMWVDATGTSTGVVLGQIAPPLLPPVPGVAPPAGSPPPVIGEKVATVAPTFDEEPVYIDDEELSRQFERKASVLAKAGKCLTTRDVGQQLERRSCKLNLPAPRTEVLTPEGVYQLAAKSTLLIGSLQQTKTQPPRFHYVSNATAWVVTTDGVIATNYHVFEDGDSESYAVMTLEGDVFPVTEIIAADRRSDVAIARIDAKGLTPIPLAKSAPVGAWVGALTHPGSAHFMFTQGSVTRYLQLSSSKNERPEKWMAISADYAVGSSGGPILDRYGNLAGMASMTEPVDFGDGSNADSVSTLQMVIKLTVPVAEIRRLIKAPST